MREFSQGNERGYKLQLVYTQHTQGTPITARVHPANSGYTLHSWGTPSQLEYTIRPGVHHHGQCTPSQLGCTIMAAVYHHNKCTHHTCCLCMEHRGFLSTLSLKANTKVSFLNAGCSSQQQEVEHLHRTVFSKTPLPVCTHLVAMPPQLPVAWYELSQLVS